MSSSHSHHVSRGVPARLGGTCLNVGCIPSKALLQASHKYHMMKHEKQPGITVRPREGEGGPDPERCGNESRAVDKAELFMVLVVLLARARSPASAAPLPAGGLRRGAGPGRHDEVRGGARGWAPEPGKSSAAALWTRHSRRIPDPSTTPHTLRQHCYCTHWTLQRSLGATRRQDASRCTLVLAGTKARS